MFLKTNHFIIILLLGAGSLGVMQTSSAQTPSYSVNTFSDPTSGISLKYPSDWSVASKDYTNAFFGNPNAANPSSSSENGATTTTTTTTNSLPSLSTTTPIVLLLPQSLDGANLVILSELLPIPMTVNKYIELTKSHLSTIPFSNAIPFSISNYSGLKYNIALPKGINQTQIAFVKDSKAFVIGYILGITNQTKDAADIKSIISSITFQTKGQGITSQSAVSSGNTGTGTMATSTLHNTQNSNAIASTSSNKGVSVSTSSNNSGNVGTSSEKNATLMNMPNSHIQSSPTSNVTSSSSTR